MVTVYVTDIRCLAGRENALAERLGPKRRTKYEAFRLRDDKLRSLAGGLLMLELLGETEAEYDEYGKPHIEGAYFNISHSGNYAALALADGDVGVDIQARTGINTAKLARATFHSDETPYADRFFDIWALKEAYIKADGRGLKLNMRSFSVISREGIDARWRFKSYTELEGYGAAVCSSDGEFSERLSFLTI